MAIDVKDLARRATVVETEIAVRQRNERACIQNAIKVLQGITEQDAEKLSRVCPRIKEIMSYTEEQLLENRNGERRVISEFFAELSAYADQRMKYFEDRLC